MKTKIIYFLILILLLNFNFLTQSYSSGRSRQKKISKIRFPEIPRISVKTAYMKYRYNKGKAIFVDAMNPKTYATYHFIFYCD
jgi:hypothetical protein